MGFILLVESRTLVEMEEGLRLLLQPILLLEVLWIVALFKWCLSQIKQISSQPLLIRLIRCAMAWHTHGKICSSWRRCRNKGCIFLGRQFSMDASGFFCMSCEQKNWQPFFQSIFSRIFAEQTALENRNNVFFQNRGHFCLIIQIMYPSRAEVRKVCL